MGGDSKEAQAFAPLLFMCLYYLLNGTPFFTRRANCWLLEQSVQESEKTVSNRVINGKSHLAITRLAGNNDAVFRVDPCVYRMVYGMTHFV